MANRIRLNPFALKHKNSQDDRGSSKIDCIVTVHDVWSMMETVTPSRPSREIHQVPDTRCPHQLLGAGIVDGCNLVRQPED